MKTTDSRRSYRLAEIIMQRLAEMLYQDIHDPRLEYATITGVRLNANLEIAEVLFTYRGDQEAQKKALAAFEQAKGFLQSGLRHLHLKYIPQLRFRYDRFVEDMVYEQGYNNSNQ